MVDDFIRHRKKPNGTYRFCVDYRKLNLKIIKDRYPLPLMDDVLDSMSGHYVFSNLDLRNGFYHVDMHPDSIQYTAFITPDGQYEFMRAPFGLCNSPSAVFQKYINMIFQDARQQGLVQLYLDDLMIPASNEVENLKKLEKVFKIAADHGLLLNFDKCNFLQRKINFLGHILADGTIQPSDEKTKAVRLFPQPKTLKEYRVQDFSANSSFITRQLQDHCQIC